LIPALSHELRNGGLLLTLHLDDGEDYVHSGYRASVTVLDKSLESKLEDVSGRTGFGMNVWREIVKLFRAQNFTWATLNADWLLDSYGGFEHYVE